MTVNAEALALHHRLVRGEALTALEQLTLQEWYAKNNAEEAAQLASARQTRLNSLEQKISEATAGIAEEAHRIQTLELENQRIRREITALENQLVQKKARQPA